MSERVVPGSINYRHVSTSSYQRVRQNGRRSFVVGLRNDCIKSQITALITAFDIYKHDKRPSKIAKK